MDFVQTHKDFDKLCVVAEFLKSYTKTGISTDEKTQLNLKLRELGLYNERNPELPLDAINHKINQLSYYMFGYQAKVGGQDRFLFSPLGNLFLKHVEDKEKKQRKFFSQCFGLFNISTHIAEQPTIFNCILFV